MPEGTDGVVDLSAAVPPVLPAAEADLGKIVEELAAYHSQFAPLYQRSVAPNAAPVNSVDMHGCTWRDC